MAFLFFWTAAVTSFAWIGFNRLAAALESRRFEFLWHGVGQENWPILFAGLKVFLVVWAWVCSFMAIVGGVWFFLTFAKRVSMQLKGTK